MSPRRKRKSEPDSQEKPLKLRGSPESEKYKMDFKNRGKCYIFNHKIFNDDKNLPKRDGTDADASNLQCTFKKLGFDVEIFSDFTKKQILDKLKEAGKLDHWDSSCFVCCILTHGEDGKLASKDKMYPTESVYAPFQGNACRSLVGKPKLFFIQACRGDKIQRGTDVVYENSKNQSDSPNPNATNSRYNFTVPTDADFLFMYSTTKGFRSFRYEDGSGSWFIKALCAALQKHAKSKDIIEILTIVNRNVSLYGERPNADNAKKQVPVISSTLTRDLKFY